jgi:hypothetical protein
MPVISFAVGIKSCIGKRITLMGGSITHINSVKSFLINVPQDISAIDINKSMPNTVMSFSIWGEDIDAMLETIDLGLVFDELERLILQLTLQCVCHFLHFVYIPQEAPACFIPIGELLSGLSESRALYGFSQCFLGNTVDVVVCLHLDVFIYDNVNTIGL